MRQHYFKAGQLPTFTNCYLTFIRTNSNTKPVRYLIFKLLPTNSAALIRLMLLIGWYTVSMSTGWAQLPAPKAVVRSEKIQELRQRIRQLVNVEDYPGLIRTGKEGMRQAIEEGNDTLHSVFSFYVGAGFEYTNRSDSAMYYYEHSEQMAHRCHHLVREVKAQIRLADLYVNVGRKEDLNRLLAHLEPLAIRTGDAALLADAHSLLGNYYETEYQYEKAISYLFKSLAYSQQQNDSSKIGVNLLNIGNTYWQAKQYERALRYSREAIPYLAAYQHGLAGCYFNIATIFRDMKQSDSTLYYFGRAKQVAIQIDDREVLANIYHDIGILHLGQGDYEQSEQALQQALQLSESLDLYPNIIGGTTRLAELARLRKQYNLARRYLSRALALAGKTQNKATFSDIYQNLALTEAALAHYQPAYEYQRLYTLYQDSLQQESSLRNVAEIEAQYQTERKQQQIALLQEQNLVQSLQLSVRRRNELLLLLGIGALGLAAGLGYRHYRRRNLLALEQVRSSIAADFHDELGANLSSIALYSDILIRNTAAEPARTAPLLENIHQNARQTLSSIHDLIWTIQPDNDGLERTLVRMKEFAIPMMEAQQIAFAFHMDESLRLAQLDMNTRKIIYLVFKESLNNVFKYARASEVSVRLTQSDRKVVLEIADNGRGFDRQSARMGNGLTNMHKRAAEIRGALTIDSQPGQGCTVRLVFRL